MKGGLFHGDFNDKGWVVVIDCQRWISLGGLDQNVPNHPRCFECFADNVQVRAISHTG